MGDRGKQYAPNWLELYCYIGTNGNEHRQDRSSGRPDFDSQWLHQGSTDDGHEGCKKIHTASHSQVTSRRIRLGLA